MENTRIEHKELLSKDIDIEKEIIAFLNYREGGVIYIGISKTGEIVGVEDADSDMLKIKDRIKHNITPSAMGLFSINAEQQDGKHIVKITVASGREKPYFKTKYGMTTKGAYIRVGTASEPMEQTMIDNLFSRRVRNSIGKIAANRQDLTFRQLQIYYDSIDKTLNENFAKSLELLTEDSKYNYAAYLLADENRNSIKVAKYASIDRSELVSNNEYGYCSLIKATHSVIDKMNVENSTATRITYPQRVDTPMWDKKALREAIVNAIVHNDYTFEVPPKFEIFPDRLEITSAGGIPDDISLEEFYMGVSSPRNKELMRIFSDVELVESLGYGVPRIVKIYGKECFNFMQNFTRMTLPISKEYLEIMSLTSEGNQNTPQVPRKYPASTPQVPYKYHTSTIQVVNNLVGEMTRDELQNILKISDREHFRKEYLNPAIEAGLVELAIPDKPRSSKQKYRLTEKGEQLKINHHEQ